MQQKFHGQIKKISGVSISATKAKPTRSDDNGLFKLIFSDVEIGESVSLTIEKQGYEVVNKKDIQDLFPNRKSPVKILLCPQGTIDKNRAAYYEINLAALKKKLRDRIALLEEEGKKKEELLSELSRQMKKQISDKNEAIALLQEQFERLKAKADELSVVFSTQNLDDQSETFRQAFAYYQQGDLEKAVYFLESANIPERLEARKFNDEQYSQIIANYQDSLRLSDSLRTIEINELVFLARLQYQTLEFEKADSSYRLALHYSRNDYDILIEYAEFLYSDGRFSDAFEQYDAIFENTTTSNDTILSWFFQGLYGGLTGRNEIVDSQIVKLSLLLPRLKKTDECEYYVSNSLIHSLIAFGGSSLSSFANTEDLVSLYHKLDTIKCDIITEDIRSTLKGILGVILLNKNIDNPSLRNYYLNQISKIEILDRRIDFVVKTTQYNQLAEYYLSTGEWDNLDRTLFQLDSIYNQADTLVKRMLKMGIAEMYVDFGYQLLNQQLLDRSKLYFTKSTELLEQLNPDDPIDLRVYNSIVPAYLSLAYIHTIGTHLEVSQIKHNSEKAYYHIRQLRKKKYLADEPYWDNMWYYHNNLIVADWFAKNKDAAIARIPMAYTCTDSLAKLSANHITTHLQRSSGYINIFFEYVNYPDGDHFVTPARQYMQQMIDYLLACNIHDTMKLNQLQYFKRMKMYFDHFTPQTRNYLHLLSEIFSMENEASKNPNSPHNYQLEKNIILKIDRALFIKKMTHFCCLQKQITRAV
ncbi:MAG: hypothetical protein IPN33_14975 [Saprospiraceae bacterium]|nr:hypothetical protein [Saprospiraceae bacterium]